jgi:hypothetical protein
MQARRPTFSAFRSGAAAAILLALGCAPHASASNIETDCASQRADRVSGLEVAPERLDSHLIDARIARPSGASQSAESESVERVAPSPEFQAVMTRILDASVLDVAEDERLPASELDSSPVAEADPDSDGVEAQPSDAEWTTDSARLPGLSDAAAERYRRQMYRTDI